MTRSALVLLSGGIDSAATLALYRQRTSNVTALFVDYGQVAAPHERAAAVRLATHYGVLLADVRTSGMGPFPAGYVRGRNALLLQVALAMVPFDIGQIAIGIHAGTSYVDCSPAFIATMQCCFDLYSAGTIRVVAPFSDQQKRSIVAFCHSTGVPIDKTYSCERGTEPPCGDCMSCLDRKVLHVE